MNGLWAYRELLAQLVRREIVVRYRHSLLGIAWALLTPLGMMLLFTFVFTRAVSLGALASLEAPYPLFLYLGVLPWSLLSAGLSGAVHSLAAHRDLVTKVYFPRQILPLTQLASALFDFCVASVVLVGLVVYYQAASDWRFEPGAALLALPVVLAVQLLFMTGAGLWLALAHLWFRDVKYLFAVGVQMWMFLTNVLYPLPADGSMALRVLAAVNPMVPIISGYRAIVLEGRLPAAGPLLAAGGAAAVLTATASAAYRVLEGRFAERA